MTNNINVNVQVDYLQGQSLPYKKRFAYQYTITIKNTGLQTVQLISRYWHIEDENKKIQEVKGLGVIGQQPHILPGTSYTYSSGAIIETTTGIMQGSYQMLLDNGQSINVCIPAFALVPPNAIH